MKISLIPSGNWFPKMKRLAKYHTILFVFVSFLMKGLIEGLGRRNRGCGCQPCGRVLFREHFLVRFFATEKMNEN